jgi:hypothetical protein
VTHSRRPRTRIGRDDRGVSPIIGTVLILVIMIFSIGGILAWGVPAIQGLQDRAEFQHVLTQFLQMDSQVRNLRDPQNTRVINLALSQGQLFFTTGDRFVIFASREAAYDGFYLSGWEGTNPASVTIRDGGGNAALAGHDIAVEVVNGGSISTRYTCTACNPVSMGVAPTVPANLGTDVVRITVKLAGNVKAEAWIMNMGRISYHQTDLNELNRLHFEMGAVFSQQNSFFFVEESPTAKDPDYTIVPEDSNLFVRALQLTGTTTTVSGDGRRPIIFNLVDNYGASRGRPSFDPATSVRVQVHGLLEVPFCNYFDQRTDWQHEAAGVVATCPTSGTAGDVNVRYKRPQDLEAVPLLPTTLEAMVFDLSHAVVTTTVRSQ